MNHDFHQLCSMNCMIVKLFHFILKACACNGFSFLFTLYDIPSLSLCDSPFYILTYLQVVQLTNIVGMPPTWFG